MADSDLTQWLGEPRGLRQSHPFSGLIQGMRKLDQWMVWRYCESPGGMRKRPLRVRDAGEKYDDEAAKYTDPNNWLEFSEAFEIAHSWTGVAGIGFVLTYDDPYIAVDLDGCIHQGQVSDFVWGLIQRAKSYTEVSPSGKGVHIYLNGRVPRQGWTKEEPSQRIEVYDKYFITVTGNHIPGTPRDSRSNRRFIESLYDQFEIKWRKAQFGSLWRLNQDW